MPREGYSDTQLTQELYWLLKKMDKHAEIWKLNSEWRVETIRRLACDMFKTVDNRVSRAITALAERRMIIEDKGYIRCNP